ncbi:rhodanese-like domain-containing protein [Thioalkalicoccus limnaeus]|uniref:Rhodanese-like domain-containing protein n=1 Tax=Thioalkalicoccus limnaeus TaxID=120681 RepID=A0ABV4BF87_9GAMM
MRQWTPVELESRLEALEAPPMLLDVREPWEFDICRIAGSVLVPMQQLPSRIGELDCDRETVVICHHGIRSYMVARYLTHQGFARVFNLQGGIAAWARDVDPSMRVY